MRAGSRFKAWLWRNVPYPAKERNLKCKELRLKLRSFSRFSIVVVSNQCKPMENLPYGQSHRLRRECKASVWEVGPTRLVYHKKKSRRSSRPTILMGSLVVGPSPGRQVSLNNISENAEVLSKPLQSLNHCSALSLACLCGQWEQQKIKPHPTRLKPRSSSS